MVEKGYGGISGCNCYISEISDGFFSENIFVFYHSKDTFPICTSLL